MIEILDIHAHHKSFRAVNSLSFRDGITIPHDGYAYSAGIHPWDSAGVSAHALDALAGIAAAPNVVAIGEAGLDKLRGAALNVQEKLFVRQAEIAESVGKPLIIHCVRAYSEIIAVKKAMRPQSAWIVHGFRGKRELALQLVSHGFMLSLGEYFNEDVAYSLPQESLLAETDESLKPIEDIIARIASARHADYACVKEIIAGNMLKLFNKSLPLS